MSLFTESFDSYNSNSATIGLASSWVHQLTSGGHVLGLTAGRFSPGQAVVLQGNSSGTSHFAWIRKYLGFASDEFSFSMGVRPNFGTGATTTPASIALHLDGVGNQIGFRIQNDLSISLVRGTANSPTELWRSDPGLFAYGTWHTLRAKGVLHDSAGSIDIMWDRDLLASLTGLDLVASGAASYDCLRLEGNNGVDMFVDDIVLIDDSTDFLPECRLQTLLPNGDGSHLDLTPSTGSDHYAVVDETPVSTTDYLQGSIDGQYDLLAVEDLGVEPASILGLKVLGFANKTDIASRGWHLGIESGGTVDDGAELSLSTDIQYFDRVLETDPDTGLAWVQSGVNAAQLKPTILVP